MVDARSQKLWSIYMVKMANGKFYTGITTDVDRRFKEHQSGKSLAAKALKGKGPLLLVFHTEVGGRSVASRAEYALKQWSHDKKKNAIDNDEMEEKIKSMINDISECID